MQCQMTIDDPTIRRRLILFYQRKMMETYNPRIKKTYKLWIDELKQFDYKGVDAC